MSLVPSNIYLYMKVTKYNEETTRILIYEVKTIFM
jgi:hypothetical protein